MDVAPWVWWITLTLTAVIFAFDLAVVGRRPHEPSLRECTTYLSIYVGMAVAFGLGVWAVAGGRYGGEFFAGWLTEYSLSVDNLFIFIVIMAQVRRPSRAAAVRPDDRHRDGARPARALHRRGRGRDRELLVGVLSVRRCSCSTRPSKLVLEGPEGDDEYEENRLVAWVEKRFPATQQWHGRALLTTEAGRRVITPMFIVILTLGTTDLLFALDSIPAIYGLTRSPTSC